MSAGDCIVIPQIEGEDSRLYLGLQEIVRSRPNVNWVYSAYLYPGVAKEMDNLGYVKNAQGEHNAKDVVEFLDVATMRNEVNALLETAKREGAVDSTGSLIDYTNSEKALSIAKKINDSYTGKSKSMVARGGLVAHVTQNSGVFNVIVVPRDAATQYDAVGVETSMQIWERAKEAFSPLIDLNTLTPINNTINAIGAYDMVTSLNGLARLDNDRIQEKDIRTIFEIYKGESEIQRLVTAYGSLDAAARATFNAFASGGRSTSSGLFSTMENALTRLKWFPGMKPGIDMTKLKADADFIKGSVASTMEEVEIQKIIDKLDADYNINVEQFHRDVNEAQTLKELTQDIIHLLERKQNEIEAMEGITPESKDLANRKDQIIRELKNKKFYLGLVGYLELALREMQDVEQLYIDAANVSGTLREKGIAMAEALNEINRKTKAHKFNLQRLTNVDSLMVNETLSPADKTVIETKARDALKLLRGKDIFHSKLRDTAMTYLTSSFMGDYAPNGMAIADLVRMSQLDSSVYDMTLYSMARASNPIIATMGGIIREEQHLRDDRLREMDDAVTAADNRLKRDKGSRKPKDFIYQETYKEVNGKKVLDTYYIASNILWESFKEARKAAYIAARKSGLKDEDLLEHMQQWEEDNTEDRIVDAKTGRTERVPDSRYQIPEADFRKNTFKTKAEEEYYDTMMQLKGELGSLLPHYAQKQYLPPQKRRTMFDALGESNGNPLLWGKAVANKMGDLFTIREDDPLNAGNGIIVEGQDYGIGIGTIDNTAYKQIPIFYVNKLKDQDELLKDFSGAMMSLASTAFNYDGMQNIRDAIEFMADYVISKTPPAQTTKGKKKKQVETFMRRQVMFSKEIADFANNTNTTAMVRGFMEKFLYGESVKNPSYKTKLWQQFLKYVSYRSLTANVKGATANALMGEYQIILEAMGGEFFGLKDWAWAYTHVFGMNTAGGIGRIVDFFRNDKTSKDVLLGEEFNVLNDNYSELSNKRFHRGFFRHILSVDLSFIGYGTGEHIIHYTNMFAILHATKVYQDDGRGNMKKMNLFDAYDTTDPVDGVSKLKLKDNLKWYDEKTKEYKDVDEEFIKEVKRIVQHVNQQCHGSMNTEDKGLIHQRMIGKSIMSLRQWAVEHYSRRYRDTYYDANLKKERTSHHKYYFERAVGKIPRIKVFGCTVGKYVVDKMKNNEAGSLFYETAQAILDFEARVAVRKGDLTKEQKALIRKARAEYITTGLLFLLNFAFPPEDYKGRWFARFWIYQLRRMFMEIGASTPGVTLITEGIKMANSPIAGVSVANSFLYIVYGLTNGDILKKVERGKYQGMNKYLRNLMKYDLPFYNQIDGLLELANDGGGFAYFDFRP